VNEQRNMILAVVLSALVLIGWTFISDRFLPKPAPEKAPVSASAPANVPGAATPATPVAKPVAAAIGESARVAIETPALRGSIALKGARIDDLVLLRHTETIKKDSPFVRLLSPQGTARGYFAGFGWTDGKNKMVPDDAVWTADGAKLTPETPVTLRWSNTTGQTFAMKFSVDKDYLFTVAQTVTNSGAAPFAARPYGAISRSFGANNNYSMFSRNLDVDSWTMQVGPMGNFNGAVNYKIDYKTLSDPATSSERFTSKGGWLGFGDTYWLAALVPAANASIDAGFRSDGGTYQADFAEPQQIVAAGQSVTTTSRLFTGAKEVAVLDRYQNEGGIELLDKAIDWGWFEILEKPLFKLLSFLFKFTGNFGIAIILLTVIVRGVMFPVAQRQFRSMAAMRVVQPKMKVLQERYKDDKPKLQQEMMALYAKEKVNPAAGCLPIFLQVPIFYALYKCLMLTIEMRHQPFTLWIQDLSAPDPANLVTLAHSFGWMWIPSFLAVGILPALVGLTMYLQFKLNPTAPDPVQQQVFSVMPWMMMFMMAPFAAGFHLYWVVSNTLTILQQRWLYSQHPALKEPVKT
jgi:YidC/Oxa1 family membrane protein insertase